MSDRKDLIARLRAVAKGNYSRLVRFTRETALLLERLPDGSAGPIIPAAFFARLAAEVLAADLAGTLLAAAMCERPRRADEIRALAARLEVVLA